MCAARQESGGNFEVLLSRQTFPETTEMVGDEVQGAFHAVNRIVAWLVFAVAIFFVIAVFIVVAT